MSIDLPKKKLRNMTGRNTTCGVFKAYAFFVNILVSKIFKHSLDTMV